MSYLLDANVFIHHKQVHAQQRRIDGGQP